MRIFRGAANEVMSRLLEMPLWLELNFLDHQLLTEGGDKLGEFFFCFQIFPVLILSDVDGWLKLVEGFFHSFESGLQMRCGVFIRLTYSLLHVTDHLFGIRDQIPGIIGRIPHKTDVASAA